jgi:hypothetical protein
MGQSAPYEGAALFWRGMFRYTSLVSSSPHRHIAGKAQNPCGELGGIPDLESPPGGRPSLTGLQIVFTLSLLFPDP